MWMRLEKGKLYSPVKSIGGEVNEDDGTEAFDHGGDAPPTVSAAPSGASENDKEFREKLVDFLM